MGIWLTLRITAGPKASGVALQQTASVGVTMSLKVVLSVGKELLAKRCSRALTEPFKSPRKAVITETRINIEYKKNIIIQLWKMSI